ncbi:uncharacterized protein BKA55DRAFT_341646 [Fusarium redolens]|uniref:Uncharacterized protein n=1 Tax=Fusarium redolens TaxID=48865 RepID=A0A9P9HAF1_FUSRE|nr:uncharacterized protein BKA55DRAFT_341646 [Fusarium redolens]KAH7253535.1 hypothetical protein BKA55DRAFT_341646 [Fusarium redolens]
MALRVRPELQNVSLFSNTFNVLIVTQLLHSLAKGMTDSDKMSPYTRISVTEAHGKSWNLNANGSNRQVKTSCRSYDRPHRE